MESQHEPSLTSADQYFETAKELIKSANYMEAIEVLKQAASIYEQLNKGKKLAETVLKKAQTHLLIEQTPEGKKLTAKLHRVIAKYAIKDPILQARATKLDAQILEQEGQYLQSISIYSKIIQEFSNTLPETATDLASVYNNLSHSYYNLGNISKAIDFLQKAIATIEQYDSANLRELATYYSNLGASYNNLEDYDKAILYTQKSLAIRKNLFSNENIETAYSYNHLGTSYVGKQDFEKAIPYFKQFLEINLELFGEEHLNVAMACGNLAGCYKSLSQYKIALNYWHRSAKIVRALFGELHPYTGIIQNNLGVGYKEIGENDKALQHFQKALQIEEQIYGSKHHQLARSLLNIAAIFTSQKKYSDAVLNIQKAIIALVEDFNENDIAANPHFKIWTGKMYLLESLSKKAKTLYEWFLVEENTQLLQYSSDTFEVVLQLIDLIRRSYDLEASHLDLSKRVRGIYNDAIEVAVLQYRHHENDIYLQKAFRFSEKIKAILLATKLQESKAKIETGIASELMEKESELRNRLTQTQQNIAQLIAEGKPKDDKQILELQSQYFDDNQAYQNLIQHFETTYPKYYQLKYDVEAVSIEALQKSLEENQWLVSYFVGEQNIHIFSISRRDFHVKSVAKPADFERLIKRFGGSIKTLNKKRYSQTAHQLYQLLLQSVVEKASKTQSTPKLTIIPHDLLTTLPFEALLCSFPSSLSVAYADFDYLLKHFYINYHYSATLWQSNVHAGKKEDVSETSFAGFAPVYNNHESAIGATINLSENLKKSSRLLSAMRSVVVRGQEFQALKYSEEEVNGICFAFEGKGWKAEAFLHQEATKECFIQTSRHKKYLLIAAHGIYNAEYPELSGIIFSPDNEANTEKAILYTNEAYQLQLQADLVVLSSCESGIGTLAVGEGMMAINRGFLYAGAKNVIFTLFKIYDEQSSQLTQLLFEDILKDVAGEIENKNYAEALRWAKLQLIRQKNIDPSAWAGFVLIGV